MSNIITIKGLSVSYDRKRVLTNIFLDIEAGKLYAVVGPNGAGKSTLFGAMLGLTTPTAGDIAFWGTSIQTQRQRVAYIPQKNDVDWTFPATVWDIVQTGRYPHQKTFSWDFFLKSSAQQTQKEHDKALTMNALREIGMEHLKDRQIGELSGGQQQRVFIARALCQQADIFFLDEPFVGVDVTTEAKIFQILKRLAAQGKTILVVHHDLSTVEANFDKVILLNQRLIAAGDVATVFNKENISKAYGAQLSVLNKMAE
jgi:ABC-type Mn2+/Zn2+ transport system ATPase subunit